MLAPKRMAPIPLFFLYKDHQYYLQVSALGVSLYARGETKPLYQLQEPILLAHGNAGNHQTIHLAILKANGELCYVLIPQGGTPQTNVLTQLDVRSTKYRRLILLPRGEMVHIFYAYAHQSIPELWYIEHRLWTGKAWQSMRLGEIVHPRSPLYHVALDSQGNIHYLGMTFQGRQSLLIQNRFHGTFYLWGNPVQTLTIPKEIVDMAAILTPDNTHHLFFAAKDQNGFEIHWAKRFNAQEISGQWQMSSAPIKSVPGPWGSMGSMELFGNLWLLIKADQEYLLRHEGDIWRQTANQVRHKPLELIRLEDKSFYQAAWLEDGVEPFAPLFHQQLGLTPKWIRPEFPHPQPVTAALAIPEHYLNREIVETPVPGKAAPQDVQDPAVGTSDQGSRDPLSQAIEPLLERLSAIEDTLHAAARQIESLEQDNTHLEERQTNQSTLVQELQGQYQAEIQALTAHYQSDIEELSTRYESQIMELKKEQAALRLLEDAITQHEEKGFWNRWFK